MKSSLVGVLIVAVILSTASSTAKAFTPPPVSRPAFKSKSASGNTPSPGKNAASVQMDSPVSLDSSVRSKSNTAALAAFATVMAPLAYHPEDELEEISIGFGIVACVVSVALGFSVGYIVP
eukprot:CAMPEP_0194274512 /NCGR_PEP_ID=MMETSP0169-20130528/7576_1 /TAXON_ID=218684 /ORGANISM="Corethron pennatum, Strain L29A3" /LENGTH=120 /DNA_ID=CAMNT_0039017721 /DNA_START=61 /DNA_END=423 /DNA_ORIENTATION=+